MIRFRIEDDSSVRSLETTLDYITIGRARGCTVALRGPGIGRFHATLQRHGTQLRLVTTGRGGGTWLNGHEVGETAFVRVGDRITVGRVHLTLEAFLPGRRVAPPPEGEDPPLPPDTALGENSPRGGGVTGLIRRAGRLLEGPEGAAPAPTDAPPAVPEVSPAPESFPSGPVPTTGEDAGYSTEMLRAPGSSGQEEARALRRILEINKRLATEVEEARLLDRILDAAAEITMAERGLLLLRAAAGSAATVEAERGGVGADRDAWTAAARRVFTSGRSVRLDGGGPSPSLLCVPLSVAGVVEGVLYVDRRGGGAFPARGLLLLEAFADQAGVALQTARLVRENRDRRQEIEKAHANLEEAHGRLAEMLRRRTVELESARQEAERARSDLALKYSYDRIVGRSAAMRTLLSLLDKVTESSVPVLVEGESGTGKELVARAIHFNGPRAEAAFVVENCAAVPDALIENELFGHEKGAFTGADRAEEGLFERADGGTLFLDEVGDMSPEMQKKVLRVLQEGEVRRVGGKTVKTVDVRVLCATNRDLVRMVKDGTFREDLFYRLCVVRVRIPPLRDRREDVPLIAAHFLDRIAAESPAGRAPRLEAEALDALAAYSWPGNVRELENEIRRAATLSEGTISLESLSAHVRETPSRVSRASDALAAAFPGDGPGEMPARTLKEEVEALERTLLVEALKGTGGNKTHAAAALGLSRLGLRKKMARYGIDG